jgi:hypothetical protein
VEPIEDVDDDRAAFAYDAEEGLPHIARDEEDRLRPFLAEHVEEGVEARRGSLLRDVKQTPATVVDLVDEREVLVALLPREVVHADGSDAVEVAVLETPANSVVHASEDGVPARAKASHADGSGPPPFEVLDDGSPSKVEEVVADADVARVVSVASGNVGECVLDLDALSKVLSAGA